MTPPKKWPHVAEWARADSIALAGLSRVELLKLIDGISDPVTLRRIARVIDNLREIETKLRECKGEMRNE